MSTAAGVLVLAGSETPVLLSVVPLVYLVRMALNAMDGLLAREHDLTSRHGAILNEIGDGVSDAVAYLPFALVIPDAAALVVAVVVLGLVGEVAALAAADQAGRRNDGPLGKSDRAFAFGAIALLVAFGFNVAVEPALVLMAALGALTVWNRTKEKRS